MKISRRELTRVIKESLLIESALEFDIGLSQEEGGPRVFYREEDGKVDAYVEDEEGQVIQKLANASGKDPMDIDNPKENERDILGALRIALEDSKDPTAKAKITKALSRLLGDDEEMVQKNMSDYLSSRHLTSASKSLREKHKFVT
tara:strand:+ start:1065 stop:1502 length:438 start_codon:yes stop_codon:yes gene_type:complete